MTPDAVRESVSAVLGDTAYREAALRIHSEITAMPAAAAVADRLLRRLVPQS